MARVKLFNRMHQELPILEQAGKGLKTVLIPPRGTYEIDESNFGPNVQRYIDNRYLSISPVAPSPATIPEKKERIKKTRVKEETPSN